MIAPGTVTAVALLVDVNDVGAAVSFMTFTGVAVFKLAFVYVVGVAASLLSSAMAV